MIAADNQCQPEEVEVFLMRNIDFYFAAVTNKGILKKCDSTHKCDIFISSIIFDFWQNFVVLAKHHASTLPLAQRTPTTTSEVDVSSKVCIIM